VNASANKIVLASRVIPMAEFLALISLIVLFVFKGLIPAWTSLRSDFPNYYIVARLFREHYALDRIYDWVWLQRVKDHWSIPQSLVGFVGLTPFSALPIVPLTWLDAMEAKRVWLVVNSGILAASLYGMQRLSGLGFRRVALIAFLAIIPLRNNFLLGQMHIVVLGLLVLAFWLDVRNKWLSCAMVLSIAASLKIYPIFFVFYFARKRQWKPAVVLAGSTLAIFAACFLIFGEPVMHAFLVEQFPRMLRGEATNPFTLTAPSASSLFHRIFLVQPETNPHPLLFSPMLYAILYPLWQLSLLATTMLTISSRKRDPRREGLEWAAFVCLLLALSTEPASYHRVALILVMALAVNAIQSNWRRAILFGCYFVACNIHPAAMPQHPALALLVDFAPYWATLALLVCLLVSLRGGLFKEAGAIARKQSWPRMRIAWSLASFAIIWAGVSATTFVHAKALNSSSYRIDRAGAAFTQFSPHIAGSQMLTVSMFLEGYRIEGDNGLRYQTSHSEVEDDQVAVASSQNSNRIWIEAVNGGHSRLVELDAASSGAVLTPIATIVDAESPGLSADGRSLVFLRESLGKGRAWLVRLDESGQPLTMPTPITPREMNIWNAQFSASNEIVLSAAENGRPHLFVLRNGAVQRLFAGNDSMDAVVTNAGSSVVVRQQMRGGYWRLYRTNSLGEDDTQLTFGDCNAYDPAWLDTSRLVYISDCGRGEKMGALAQIDAGTGVRGETRTSTNALRASRSQGESQE
jgi:hypothetical protein